MSEKHDLLKLESQGFHLFDERVQGQLDGVSAILHVNETLRIQIYQGCEFVYESQSQGRGRAKENTCIGLSWYSPVWYIGELVGKREWGTVASGNSETVDKAVGDALERFQQLFPNVRFSKKAEFTLLLDHDGYWLVDASEAAEIIAAPEKYRTGAVKHATKIAACRLAIEKASAMGATEVHIYGQGTTAAAKEIRRRGMKPFIYIRDVLSDLTSESSVNHRKAVAR